MKRELSKEDIIAHFNEIDGRPTEEATAEDLAAISAAEAEPAEDTITLEEYKAQKEYSGKLLLRIPRDLHRELAEAAKRNGVSINQYAAYKLAR